MWRVSSSQNAVGLSQFFFFNASREPDITALPWNIAPYEMNDDDDGDDDDDDDDDDDEKEKNIEKKKEE